MVFDAVRNGAILGVLLIHTCSWASSRTPPDAQWIPLLINTLCRWCVPFFLMISGALLLGKAEPAPVFYRKRLRRVAVPFLAWSAIYLAWDHFYLLDGGIVWREIPARFIRGAPKLHLWFISTLLTLYVFVPLLRGGLQRLGRRWTAIAAASLLAIAGCAEAGWALTGAVTWKIPPQSVVFSDTLFFLGYFLLGWVIKELAFSDQARRWSGAVGALALAASGAGYLLVRHFASPLLAEGLFHNYLGFPVILTSAALLIWALRPPVGGTPGRFRRLLGNPLLARLSFGIYLVHLLFLELLFKDFPGLAQPTSWIALNLALTGALVFGASFAVSWGLSRMPVLRATIGL